MKTVLAVPTLALLLATPAFAQTTGTAHPEDLNDTITAQTSEAPSYPQSQPANSQSRPAAKPSPDVPMSSGSAPNAAPAQASDHYVPPSRADVPADATSSEPQVIRQSVSSLPLNEQLADPQSPSGSYSDSVDARSALQRHSASAAARDGFTVTDDPNSGVVIDVPTGPNELPIGTLLKARLRDTLSTTVSRAGTHFTAVLSADVESHGKVLLPAGSLVTGRITQVHGGHRIGGAAAIRLQPDTITLPDGTLYRLDADVTDLDHFQDSHVNSEGAIIGNEHPKATLAALGLTTGSAAVAGAVIGGGVGAVVGASIGAGAGVIWWLRRDRQETLPQDTEIVFSLNNSLQVSPVN